MSIINYSRDDDGVVLRADFKQAVRHIATSVPEGSSAETFSMQAHRVMLAQRDFELRLNIERSRQDIVQRFEELNGRNLRAEMAWACIQRYCEGRNIINDGRFAYSLMFVADCMEIERTRPEKGGSLRFASFTEGEWQYDTNTGECYPPGFLSQSYAGYDWDCIAEGAFSDEELDKFQSSSETLSRLFEFTNNFDENEWAEYLDSIKIWTRVQQSTYLPINVRHAAQGCPRLIALPEDVKQLRVN